MTLYCAMTADGNQPRFETGPLTGGQSKLEFEFLSATNLLGIPRHVDQHSELMSITIPK